MKNLKTSVWNEDDWLMCSKVNMTWREVDGRDDVFPHLSELAWALPVAIAMCCARFVCDKVISSRAARYLNVRESCARHLTENAVLETAFQQSARLPDRRGVIGLAKRVDMSPRQVERWWRRKMISQKPSVMRKFNESTFRCLAYIVLTCYGFYTLTSKPWFLDTNHCWYDWPIQAIDNDVAIYYKMDMALNLTLLLCCAYDTKKKDFIELVVHHVTTIILLCLSWSFNFVRMGSFLIVVLESPDGWIEAAKMAIYTKHTKLANVLFRVFTVVWYISRLIFFPFWILKPVLHDFPDVMGLDGEPLLYTVFKVLLILLFILQIMWSATIARMLYVTIQSGHVDDDSETEPSSTSEDETTRNKTRKNSEDETTWDKTRKNEA